MFCQEEDDEDEKDNAADGGAKNKKKRKKKKKVAQEEETVQVTASKNVSTLMQMIIDRCEWISMTTVFTQATISSSTKMFWNNIGQMSSKTWQTVNTFSEMLRVPSQMYFASFF